MSWQGREAKSSSLAQLRKLQIEKENLEQELVHISATTCEARGGRCLDSNTEKCTGEFWPSLCAGSRNIKCCVTLLDPIKELNPTDACWPVRLDATGVLKRHHFGRIAGKLKCHSGCDIYTKNPGVIMSMADGEVLGVHKDWYRCSKGWSNINRRPKPVTALVIYHKSLGMSINYGEINSNELYVRKGDKVKRGQELGVAGDCGMIHLETRRGRYAYTSRWMVTKQYKWNCLSEGARPPGRLLNCNNLLLDNDNVRACKSIPPIKKPANYRGEWKPARFPLIWAATELFESFLSDLK